MSEPETESGESRDDEQGERSGGDTDARSDLRPRLVRAGHVLGVLLLIAIVLPFLVFAVPQLIGAEASYVVTSGSMEPAIAAGSITFVDAVPPAAVDEGDVINFQRRQDDRTTTHRVIEIVEQDGATTFRTAGDNNDSPDQGVVTPDEFRGKVMSVGGVLLTIPYVGYVINYASTQTGFTLLFVIPVTLLVLNEVWNVVSSARSRSTETTAPDDGPTGDRRASETPEASGADGGRGVSFSATELRLAVAVLAAFVAYGVWTSYNELNAVNVGVTGSATVALLMLGGLYAVGNSSDDGVEPASSADESADGLFVHDGKPSEIEDGETEEVALLETLLHHATTTDAQVYRDPDDGTYHLVDDGTRFVYEPVQATMERNVLEEAADDGATAGPSWGPPPSSLIEDGSPESRTGSAGESGDD